MYYHAGTVKNISYKSSYFIKHSIYIFLLYFVKFSDWLKTLHVAKKKKPADKKNKNK